MDGDERKTRRLMNTALEILLCTQIVASTSGYIYDDIKDSVTYRRSRKAAQELFMIDYISSAIYANPANIDYMNDVIPLPIMPGDTVQTKTDATSIDGLVGGRR